MAKVSRRHFTGAVTGSILLGARLPAWGQTVDRDRITADACVVGAGFAGLAAAYRLQQAGADVVVLEARNRVGGRSLTLKTPDGAWADLGAQWVGPTQDRFMALIKEMGCETYRSLRSGIMLQRGVVDPKVYDRIPPRHEDSYRGARLVNAAMDRLDQLARRLDPEQPWTYPDAERLDATTFAEWMRQNVSHDNARRFVARQVASIACASPEELSILHTLFLIKSCRGLADVLGDEGGAQQDLLIGGTQTVAQRLADKLGGAIRQNAAVRRIEWDEKGAVVHTDQLSAAVRHVVVAVPPHMAGAIEYQAGLPAARAQVTQRWPQGTVIKVQIIYAEPFWRRAGLSGESYDYLSILGETDDGSVPERYSRAGHFCGFIYADFARKAELLNGEQRKRLVLAELAKRFGREALTLQTYFESSWSTQYWTGGCFTGFLTPGSTVLFRSAVRDPVGPLHWAGTETATMWPSFIDGAIRSGERAAMEIRKGT